MIAYIKKRRKQVSKSWPIVSLLLILFLFSSVARADDFKYSKTDNQSLSRLERLNHIEKYLSKVFKLEKKIETNLDKKAKKQIDLLEEKFNKIVATLEKKILNLESRLTKNSKVNEQLSAHQKKMDEFEVTFLGHNEEIIKIKKVIGVDK